MYIFHFRNSSGPSIQRPEPDKGKSKIIVLCSSILLLAISIILEYFFRPQPGYTALQIFSVIMVDIFLFCIPPSFRFFYLALKESIKKDDSDFSSGLNVGYKIGLNFLLYFLLLLLLSPYFMFVYYFK